MEVFINGDIYIKVKPDVFKFDDNPMLDSILELTDNFTSKMDNPNTIDEINEMRESLLENLKEKDGSLDFSRCDKFYKLLTDGSNIFLKSLGYNLIDSIIKYNNFEDILTDYETLSNLLDNSTFIGRHVKSINPVVDLLGIKCVALYKKGYTLIAKIYDESSFRYIIHAGEEILNDELEYCTDVDYNFDNKDIVYKEIRQQFSEGYERRL